MRLIERAPSGTQRVIVLGAGERELPTWTPTAQGEELRRRRRAAGVSLSQAARRARVKMSTWSAVESGRATVSAEDFERLLAAVTQPR